MFQPEFMAVCDPCGEVTPWFKSNRMVQASDGTPATEMGFKCAACGAFEERVLDTRGRVRVREPARK